MSLGARITGALFLSAVMAACGFAIADALGLPWLAAIAAALLMSVPAVVWGARRVLHHFDYAMTGLDDGLRAFRDSDFSMRLASRGKDRISLVKRTYNEVADRLRTQRNDVYQKELLLDTILQRTPTAVLLLNGAGRVVFANMAAREIFAAGARIEGHDLAALLRGVADPVREALEAGGDALVTIPGSDQEETFLLSQRTFRLNTLEHRLVLVERLTAQLRRQEIAVWKNAIRVINHELNNTIAPISSLLHSAKIAQERPERRHQLGEIYETIEERLAFLRAFLDSYAQFARLPAPRKSRTEWEGVIADVRALYGFRFEGDAREAVNVDRAQMQQVLINLVKNAHESGSDPAEIVVSVRRAADGSILRVEDRGRGMSDEVMRQALVPFYTTKPAGSGLGLALSNEIVEAHGGRMRLQAREGGGVVVSCFLPA